jgi:cell division protein FtsL
MRDEEPVLLAPRLIDNSRVVRQADPRTNRDLWGLLVLVALVVAGIVFYAWPHLAARETGNETNRLTQEMDRLVEENRKLRLEKASLEDLRRVERIATRRLELETPPPEQVVVVKRSKVLPEGTRLARGAASGGGTSN